jgi:alcohol dehydrogenase
MYGSHHVDVPGVTAFRFTTPDTYFGDGIVADLGVVLDRYGISDPLFVTDRGVEEAGLLDTAVNTVDETPVIYYASTEPSTDDFDNLPTEVVDGVVAVGGGSCLDTAKLAAVLLAHGGHPAEYVGVDHVPGPVAPLITVPTTSGTGSQATQTAVLSHDGVKRGASDEYLRPDVALVDPELTFELPKSVTARSGFDAFVHALESLLARDYQWVEERPITYQGANPISRSLAWRALRLVHGSLERAIFDGDDRDARRAMSLGSHLAGTAFSASGLGAVHALASTLGGMTDRPHGECLAASIRAGLTYNLPVRHEQYGAVAHGLGVGDASVSETPPEALIAECERLRDSIGLPGSFKAVGLAVSDVDTIVDNTLVQERRLTTNPRTVTDDLREFLLDIELST